MDKVSYAIGMNIAANLRQSGVDSLDVESLSAGLTAVLSGGKPELSSHEAGSILNKFFAELEEARQTRNIEEGKAFLARNAKRSGVVTLPSGLQYEVLREGSGSIPTLSDTVRCHYHGTLISGKVFDSSVQRGAAASFPVSGVIKGWTEALQLMSVGSKWKLFIPSDLAYGARGAGEDIGPHTTLIFEVELLGIV